MFFRLLFLLTIVPIVELVILTQVHQAMATRLGWFGGLWATIGMVLATGIAGAALARIQGLGVLRRLSAAAAAGKFPAPEILDGALILIGACLLITPGFLTDVVGLTLLIPPTRAFWRRAATQWLRRNVAGGRIQFGGFSTTDASRDDDVIDVSSPGRP